MNAVGSLRDAVRKHVPEPLRAKLRDTTKIFQPRPIEESVLHAYSFIPDLSEVPRLNLVIPGLQPQVAFGGVNTGVELMLRLTAMLRKMQPLELRFLTESSDSIEATVVPRIAKAAGMPIDGVSVEPAPRGCGIHARRSDIFITYNWWVSLNIQPVIESQTQHYNIPPLPKIHLLQEYEPHFYPFSSAHLYARLALNLDWPLWVIFNSHELEAYHRRLDDRADRRFVFDPVLNTALRPFSSGIDASDKRRRLLVYARPLIDRNCFSILREALGQWAALPEAQGWDVVSAGAVHKPMPLGSGVTLRPLGKLTLDAYGQLLRETAVGLSLMSSPHPSYPPLEMAHFGVRVVTNDYVDKNLSQRHGNIMSVGDIRPAAIAAALASQCAAFERDPGEGLRRPSGMPTFLDGDISCLDAVAASLRELWS